MMILMTKGELSAIRRLLKQLMNEDTLLADVYGDLCECHDMVDNALKYSKKIDIPDK